jgi:hypothetical protein
MDLSFRRLPPSVVALLAALLLTGSLPARAMPAFARQYELSCVTCHNAYPRLNDFGERFREANMRLPNWKEKATIDMGDPMLALPKFVPLAIRAQAYVQARDAREVNSTYTGFTANNGSVDFQAPYLIKLLSSAPLSDHISYYFYGIFAEKGANGTTVIEDAWFRHDDAFNTGIGATLGQFQISDLMFPRELRLPFQDYLAYRMAGITYDRGLLLDRALGRVRLSLGAVNGNGIDQNFNLNSPGYQRPDAMFDNNTSKTVFGRVGSTLGPVTIGLFGLTGSQKSATGTVGQDTGTRDTDKRVVGLDLSGRVGAKLHWYAQTLWNSWDGFLDANPSQNYHWFGSFAGIDYIHDDHWVYSLLYNYDNAKDFRNTGTIFEGIDMNTITLTASYYFMRNVKGVIEFNGDLLKKKDNPNFVGHVSQENYFLMGFDAAF